jgi:deoxyribonuclease-4
MRKLGVHTSIAGGIHKSLERAIALGCNTVQIFSHNPRGWTLPERRPDEIAAFREFREKHTVTPVVIHASYLINLASRESRLRRKSITMVAEEMNIADSLGAEYVVLHTGSASGDLEKIARERTISSLAEVASQGKWRAGLLLENTAGKRGDITSRIPELSDMVLNAPKDLIAGICLDSCHAFASGYDVASAGGVALIFREIERFIGKEKIKLLHLNDSKGELGSGIDRHEHIGKGRIGITGIEYLVNFPDVRSLPLILETPRKDDEDDRKNLRVVRNILKA